MVKRNPEKALPIYLDYMATTPVDERVVAEMNHYLDKSGCFGNPTSTTHIYGFEAQQAILQAKIKISELIHCTPSAISFTSGATEANNLAILGAAQFYQSRGKHLITLSTEHEAVLGPMHFLESLEFSLTVLNPKTNGLLDLIELEKAIRPDTILISIMHANNEIGVIQDIEAIGKIARAKGILFHVDAAQSVGKIEINLEKLPVDLMSFSAHKIYGPKGIGALFVRQHPKIHFKPLLFGGGENKNIRPGTLATHQIVGMGTAFELAKKELGISCEKLQHYRNKIWESIKDLPGIQLNGCLEKRLAGNLNFSVAGVDPESLLLSLHELAISTSAACHAQANEVNASPVLRALGVSEEMARTAIRLSVGRFTTESEINRTIELLREKILFLKKMAPL